MTFPCSSHGELFLSRQFQEVNIVNGARKTQDEGIRILSLEGWSGQQQRRKRRRGIFVLMIINLDVKWTSALVSRLTWDLISNSFPSPCLWEMAFDREMVRWGLKCLCLRSVFEHWFLSCFSVVGFQTNHGLNFCNSHFYETQIPNQTSWTILLLFYNEHFKQCVWVLIFSVLSPCFAMFEATLQKMIIGFPFHDWVEDQGKSKERTERRNG